MFALVLASGFCLALVWARAWRTGSDGYSFLVWNLGDLAGRLVTLLPFSMRHRPAVLFILATLRIGFLPLYLLCNIQGRGAKINSDAFYLFVVQLGFGGDFIFWLATSDAPPASICIADDSAGESGIFTLRM